MNDVVISAENLCAGYTSPVVSGVDFSVRGGEVLVLIGPNGGGKTTLLKALTGNVKRFGGKVSLLGRDDEKMKPRERAKIMSVLLTEKIRAEKMTCREVVETGRYPYTGRFGLLSPSDKRAASLAMETVGVKELEEKDFAAISDGQRQRVMLARAICQEPKALILDEPTSYLDIHHKLLFIETIKKLAYEKKIAVIMSMHEPELAAKAASGVLCIKEGRVCRSGKPEEIFTSETLCALFDISAELYEKYYQKGNLR